MRLTSSHTRTKTIIRAILVASLAVGLMAGSVLAGKPTGGSGGGGKGKPGGGGTAPTGGLVLRLVTDQNGDGAPNWGDTIRFDVTNTSTSEPHVNLTCSQGGQTVYGATTGYYASYPWPWTQNMTLSSGMWTGGGASCSAVLQKYSGTTATTIGGLNFSVAP
jgi:hypothetical protein